MYFKFKVICFFSIVFLKVNSAIIVKILCLEQQSKSLLRIKKRNIKYGRSNIKETKNLD
jgi:hypothetical protein